MNIYQVINQPC